MTGLARPKQADAYRIVGHPTERLDLLAKVTGGASFVHDMDLPGMLHGRAIRPPHYGAQLVAVDEDAVLRCPALSVSFVMGVSWASSPNAKNRPFKQWRRCAQAQPGTRTVLARQKELFDHLLSQP